MFAKHMRLESTFSLIAVGMLLSFSAPDRVWTESTGGSEHSKKGQASSQRQDETVTDMELQETEHEGRLAFSISPDFKDVIDKDFVMLRLRLRYGLTENLELRTEMMAYSGTFATGNGDVGLGRGLLGVKYKFEEWPGFWDIRSATGVSVRFPLGEPPEEIVSGYTHWIPYIVFSRFMDSLPKLETFFNASFDLVSDTPFRDRPEKDRPEHSMTLTLGGIYYQSDTLRGALDVSWKTSRIAAGDYDQVFVTPAVYWTLPKKYTWFSPGYWQLGVGLEIPVLDQEDKLDVFVKVKWDFDFLKVIGLKKKKEAS